MLQPDLLAERLAGALAIPTVRPEPPAPADAAPFLAFQRYLEQCFPRCHDRMTVEAVGHDHARLYTWHGSAPEREPWMLISHQDVVPVEPGSEPGWTHPPFGGTVASGYIWGRGALDLKVTLIGALEACEALLTAGFRPRRTVYLAFGADEEHGGRRGAAAIARTLRERGVRLAFTLDEGGTVLSGALPGVRKPVAFIGTAEKGHARLHLTAEAAGGHSSLPPAGTAADRLIRALARLERHPMPARLDHPTRDMLGFVAEAAAEPHRRIYRHLWLTAPLVRRFLLRQPAGNAVLRTTAAVTRLQAGLADNAIPAAATAWLSLRLKPGDRVDAVVGRLRRLLARDGVGIEVGESTEASGVSSLDSAGFRALTAAIRSVLPDVVPAPCLVPSASDSRHYLGLARDQYRFVPVRLTPGDLKHIHGTDERIAVENYAEVVRFLEAFVRRADEAP